MALSNLDLEDVEKILGRCLIDSAFRAELTGDPERTLRTLGYGDASQDAIDFFRALDVGAFPGAAAEVENRLGGRRVIGLWL